MIGGSFSALWRVGRAPTFPMGKVHKDPFFRLTFSKYFVNNANFASADLTKIMKSGIIPFERNCVKNIYI